MRYLKEFYRFLKHIFHNKNLIIVLIKNDFKKHYMGSYLGFLWAFIQPLVFIFVIWFVFEVGFRSTSSSSDIPFFLYLICGMVPWFFISTSLINATNALVTNSFLLKKIAFRVSILPLVQIGSTLIIHLVLLFLLGLISIFYGFLPTIYWLQLPIYLILVILLMLGVTWMTSSLRLFIKDISNFVVVLVQVGFWGTPIFWSVKLIPDSYIWLIKINPAYFIIEGYRNTFIYNRWFWEETYLLVYNLLFILFLLLLGGIIFKRLRPHFGDVI